MAVQIYLTDYDRFPQSEHRQEVFDWLASQGEKPCTCNATYQNPYLRWMVVFDEYTKNRDVWRCPSQKHVQSYMINPCVPDWFTAMQNGPNDCNTTFSNDAFPPGWGGSITDSYKQRNVCASGSTGGVDIGIGVATWWLQDVKVSVLNDPSKTVVCGDGGVKMEFSKGSQLAYPDTCRIDGAACGCAADWANCGTVDCGAGDPRFGTDPTWREEKAGGTRHMGGSNIGFADGHAAWWPSEAILFGGDESHAKGRIDAPLEGLSICGSLWPPQ